MYSKRQLQKQVMRCTLTDFTDMVAIAVFSFCQQKMSAEIPRPSVSFFCTDYMSARFFSSANIPKRSANSATLQLAVYRQKFGGRVA